MIKRQLYIERSRRLKRIGSVVFLVVGGGSLVAVVLLVGRSGGLIETVRDYLSDFIHPHLAGVVGILPFLPVLAIPIVLPVLILRFIDRRLGIRFPFTGCCDVHVYLCQSGQFRIRSTSSMEGRTVNAPAACCRA